MTLYKVIVKQKITKTVLAVVDADTEDEAKNKVCSNDIISIESTLDTKIDEHIPIYIEKY